MFPRESRRLERKGVRLIAAHAPRFARITLVFVLAVAILDWIGWALGIEALTRLSPAWPVMTPWTAVWTGGLAVAALLQVRRRPSGLSVAVARGVAVVVLLLSLLVLLAYITGLDLGMGLWFFGDQVSALQSTYPGRPSPQTAITTALVATLVLLLRVEGRWVAPAWTLLALGSLVVPMLAIGGYLFQASEIYLAAPSTGMAFTTAASLLAAGISAMAARLDRPPSSWLMSLPDPEPVLRTMLVVLGLPLLIWALRDVLESFSMSGSTALALSIALSTLVVAAGVFLLSARFSRASWEKLRLADDLAQANARYRMLAENSADVVVHVEGRTISWISESVATSLGAPQDTWLGRDLLDFLHPDDRESAAAAIDAAIAGETVRQRARMCAPGRPYHWVEASAKLLHDEGGASRGLVGALRVIDEQVAAELELERLARIDVLTGLPNRAVGLARLEAAQATVRSAGEEVGVLFCDVDHFKAVNDTLGHAAGDEVLQTLTRRLSEVLRPEDVLARIGGDELLVIATGLHSMDEVAALAERMRVAGEEPIVVDHQGTQAQVSLSIGVALARPGETTDELVARADAAMYEAKQAGRNRVTRVE